jgi:predicted lipoprotein with Yx(FWY)xxD motif
MKQLSLKGHYGLMVLLLVCLVVGCKDKETTPSNDVELGTTSLGNVLTGEGGKTLYFFASDVSGISSCTSTACMGNWPVFYKEVTRLGTGLTLTDFGTITRPDGAKQTTYKGWPLYYYKSDTKAGDVTGENVGNVWAVAKADYSIMLANAQLVGNNGKSYTSDYKEGTGNTIYFTDGIGRTLYGFVNDKNKKNNYTKADMSNNATWPLFEEATLKSIPSTLAASDFVVIDVTGTSKKQLTYKGWPLYYFGPDNSVRGANKGVSVPTPGIWPIVNKNTVVAPN